MFSRKYRMTHKTSVVTKQVTQTVSDVRWQTILYDCDCHEFWDVVYQIMLAIRCTKTTASRYASTAQDFGLVAVYKGEKEKCEQVADVLGSIGLDVKVTALM
jgi:hypothetical protein